MKTISLFVVTLLLCSCASMPVEEGPSSESVKKAIQQYEKLGAPGNNEDHELQLGYQVNKKGAAEKAFRQMIQFFDQLSDLKENHCLSEIYLTDTGYYYCVITGSDHVYLFSVKKESTKAFWIAIM